MRIGVLTGGGDCPGLNAVIRAVVRKGVGVQGHEFVGYRDGWRGPLEDDRRPLGVPEVRGILPRGGTILGSSRTNPFALDDGPARIAANLEAAGVDGLIAIGGEDTLGAASRLHSEHGLNVVGVPKTIDNDLSATDYTFGFDTAINIAMEAIDRLHTTADSHHRVLIVEVMGRHAGWIAVHAGLAGGANAILIPEREFDVGAVCDLVGRRFASHFAPIIVVAEGAKPIGGMPDRGRLEDRRLRPRPPRRGRPLAGGRDRADHRQRDPRHRPRPRPARRHPDRLRPGPRHPLRPARDRCRERRAAGARWRRCAGPTSSWSS